MKLQKQLSEKWPIIIMIISASILLFAGFQLLQYYGNFREESALDEHLKSIHNKIMADGYGDGKTGSPDETK